VTNQEVNIGAVVSTTFVDNVEIAVDTDIVKITAEKHPESGDFASADDGHDRGSHDGDEGREEV
jgi:hypothetical protein